MSTTSHSNTDAEKIDAKAVAANENMHWYFIQVYSGSEQSVAKTLKDRIASKALSAKFGQILVLTEEVVEVKNGKKRKSDRKFFPGYVLLQMDCDEESWHLVNEVPKVIGFVGGKKGNPTPISAKEAEKIMNQIQQEGEKPKPKTLYDVGQEIRVIDGPFADFKAVVEDVNYEKSRLRVAVSIFGRSTSVELDFTQVEKT